MPASLRHLFQKTAGELSNRFLYCHPEAPDGQADWPRIVNFDRLLTSENHKENHPTNLNLEGINVPDMVVSVLYHHKMKTLEAFFDMKVLAIQYNHHGPHSRIFIERKGSLLHVCRLRPSQESLADYGFQCGGYQLPGLPNDPPKIEFSYSILDDGKWKFVQARNWGRNVDEAQGVKSAGILVDHCIQNRKWTEDKAYNEKIVVETHGISKSA